MSRIQLTREPARHATAVWPCDERFDESDGWQNPSQFERSEAVQYTG
jgi:hypothetical protein